MANTVICKHCKKEYSNIVGIDNDSRLYIEALLFLNDSIEQDIFNEICLCEECYLKLLKFLDLEQESKIRKE